jgi:hypothetical protein
MDYNIKMNLNKIGWGGVDWMDLAYRMWWVLVNMVMNIWISVNVENFVPS